MAFPPAEENLDVPSELVGKGNLFGGEVVASCFGLVPLMTLTASPLASLAEKDNRQ
jgi:hypothetical protein